MGAGPECFFTGDGGRICCTTDDGAVAGGVTRDAGEDAKAFALCTSDVGDKNRVRGLSGLFAGFKGVGLATGAERVVLELTELERCGAVLTISSADGSNATVGI